MRDLADRNERRAMDTLAPHLAPLPVLLVISGPSGVGKDTVVQRMRDLGYSFHFVVTVTDRAPRPGEVDGADYHFVSTAEFEDAIARGDMLEHAIVYGQHKGVPRAGARRALASGVDVIMRLDVQGAATVRRLVPNAITVFVAPPSIAALGSRLGKRSSDSAEQIASRLATAVQEMSRINEFGYVVVNYDNGVDRAAEDIAAILSAERHRVGRQPVRL